MAGWSWRNQQTWPNWLQGLVTLVYLLLVVPITLWLLSWAIAGLFQTPPVPWDR